MNLILFSCKARLNSYFRQKKALRLFLLAIGVVLSAMYSWIFAELLQKTAQGALELTVEKTISYTNLLLLAVIILRGFFPAYIPRAEFISRLYPIKPIKRFWLELVVELASPFYFILFNFLMMLFLLSPIYGFAFFMQSIMVMVAAHVTRRSLQLFVERRMRWGHSTFISAAVMGAAFLALQAKAPMFEPNDSLPMLLVHIASLASFVVSNFLLEQAAVEPRLKVVSHTSNSRRSLGWRLFKNNKTAKQLLFFAIGFKLLMLAVDATVFTNKGFHVFDKNMSMWLFVGPLVLYSYVFNNLWGFYKNMWLTIERTTGNYKDFLKTCLLALRIPLMIDAGLMIAYVAIFNHEHAMFILLMYATAILVLTPISIVASIVSPVVVKGGAMSFSAKTSYLFNFISILLMGMLFLPLIHPLLYLIYPLLIGIAFFALVAVLKEYKSYKYKLFETFFKA
ncbi:hypothetical protein [Pontibacter harenae]|uniref:hypothetical protein n=1 Tax=Pontibacter harenae TaxID=2894083 RepID=UPI001E5A49D6|nr:hypothetical protein [Pontibacter harenae]MCC9165781.1 hypothetical protein [Pontibacter harenae]